MSANDVSVTHQALGLEAVTADSERMIDRYSRG